MPRKPFEQTKVDTKLDTGKHDETVTGQAVSKHKASEKDQNPDTRPVGPGTD